MHSSEMFEGFKASADWWDEYGERETPRQLALLGEEAS